jgi:hypothetical protein
MPKARPPSARYTPSHSLGRMHCVPEDRRRLVYLEFELERRLLAHERALRKSLWDLGGDLE